MECDATARRKSQLFGFQVDEEKRRQEKRSTFVFVFRTGDIRWLLRSSAETCGVV